MKVEVVRSRRRRKTVQARQVGDVVRVSVPATMSRSDEERWVKEMVSRIERRQRAGEIDLRGRALALATRFGMKVPASVRWADNQLWRWGSCTPADGSIRVSSRLAKEPPWVLDYVLVHELAHLHVKGHNRAFWELVNRYPLAERARGFLLARGAEPDLPEAGPELPELPERPVRPGPAPRTAPRTAPRQRRVAVGAPEQLAVPLDL